MNAQDINHVDDWIIVLLLHGLCVQALHTWNLLCSAERHAVTRSGCKDVRGQCDLCVKSSQVSQVF